jgi:iron complex transport system permease protein
MKWNRVFILVTCLFFVSALDLFISIENISFSNLIFKLRFYRVFTALIAGGGLAICGLVLQTWFRNSLADPFLLGVNSGANLFIALGVFSVNAIGFNLGELSLVGLGIAGAIFSLSVLLIINRYFQNSVYLIIFGLLFSYLASGIISFLMTLGSEQELKSFLLFSFGSFEKVLGNNFILYAITIFIFCLILFNSSKNLNYLLLGENYAASLGLNLKKYQRYLILMVGVISGIIGVFCGPIVFIGMMGPHLVRFIFDETDHTKLVPLTFISGGFLAVFSDLIYAHVLGSSLPLNTVIGLIGTPIVGYVLLRNSWRLNNA